MFRQLLFENLMSMVMSNDIELTVDVIPLGWRGSQIWK
jgi:hypothetical protein